MTLQQQAIYLIPTETERVVCEAFPTGSPMMALRDALGMVFADRDVGLLIFFSGKILLRAIEAFRHQKGILSH